MVNFAGTGITIAASGGPVCTGVATGERRREVMESCTMRAGSFFFPLDLAVTCTCIQRYGAAQILTGRPAPSGPFPKVSICFSSVDLYSLRGNRSNEIRRFIPKIKKEIRRFQSHGQNESPTTRLKPFGGRYLSLTSAAAQTMADTRTCHSVFAAGTIR